MTAAMSIRIPRFALAEVVKADPIGVVGDIPIHLHQVFHSLYQLGYVFHVGEVWVGKRPTRRVDHEHSTEGASDILYQCRGHERNVLWVSNNWAAPCEHVCVHIRSVHALAGFPVGRVATINPGNARHIWFKDIDPVGSGSTHPIYLAHLLPLDGRRLGYTFFSGETAVDKFPVGRNGADGYWCAQHGGRITTGGTPHWRSDQYTSSHQYCHHIRDVHSLDDFPTRGDGYELLDAVNIAY